MRVLVTVEQRFDRTPEGHVWTRNVFPYAFWQRYLSAFERVTVAARVCEVATPPVNSRRADGDRVDFAALPHYIGPMGFVRVSLRLLWRLRSAVQDADAVILRIPSIIGAAAGLLRGTRPAGVEVVGDPYEVFSNGVVSHPFRSVFRLIMTASQKRLCRKAVAAAYVTECTLQERYPTDGEAFAVSDADLPHDAFVSEPHREPAGDNRAVIIAVGSMAQLYKGYDVLIHALAILKKRGTLPTTKIVGDGMFRPMLERLADSLGLTEDVHFLGELPGAEAVRRELDTADLFVLPSRTEGLSRALLEAMARGLPAVATSVGGSRELLASDATVPPDRPDLLAESIGRLLACPDVMRKASADNLMRARAFTEERLAVRREAFYAAVLRHVDRQACA